jgi:hypothetical protein
MKNKEFDLTEEICGLVYEGWNDSKEKPIREFLAKNGLKPARIEKIIKHLGNVSEEFHESGAWNSAGDRASKHLDKIIAKINKRIEKLKVKA